MTCPNCGLEHPYADPYDCAETCRVALIKALRHTQGVNRQLLDACQEALDLIRRRVQWVDIRPDTPLLAQLKLAIQAAEEEMTDVGA